METTVWPRHVQYLVGEDGQRTGVVLAWPDYQALRAAWPDDPEQLAGFSEAELEALSEGLLTPAHQARLTELLQRNRTEGLSTDETRELDHLLEQVDDLNTLKARAQYTLHQLRLA
jgi:hypothetical protein